jgi:hypothetical protein
MLTDNKTKRVRSSNSFVSVIISWLGLRDGNITFSDELDFDPAELDMIYEDDAEGQK